MSAPAAAAAAPAAASSSYGSKRPRPLPAAADRDEGAEKKSRVPTIECPVCKEDLHEDDPDVRVLPCTDRVCFTCVEKLIKLHRDPHLSTIVCPQCQRDQPVHDPTKSETPNALASKFPSLREFRAELRRNEEIPSQPAAAAAAGAGAGGAGGGGAASSSSSSSAVAAAEAPPKRPPSCSEDDCHDDATHYCMGCGLLCALHEEARHVHTPDHVRANLADQQQRSRAEKDAALAEQRKNDHINAVVEPHVVAAAAAAAEAQQLKKEKVPLLPSLSADLRAALQGFLGAGKQTANAQLLYKASRDGFKAEDFYRCCCEKGPTLMIVKAAKSGYLFGAYTAVSWPKTTDKLVVVPDPSGASFLFSLINKDKATHKLVQISNLVLMINGKRANVKEHNFANHMFGDEFAYQVDPWGPNGPPKGFRNNRDTFIGANKVNFAANEIEVYAL